MGDAAGLESAAAEVAGEADLPALAAALACAAVESAAFLAGRGAGRQPDAEHARYHQHRHGRDAGQQATPAAPGRGAAARARRRPGGLRAGAPGGRAQTGARAARSGLHLVARRHQVLGLIGAHGRDDRTSSRRSPRAPAGRSKRVSSGSWRSAADFDATGLRRVRRCPASGEGHGRQVEHGGVGVAARVHPLLVELADQPLGVDADRARDGADVAAHVEVPAARLVVIGLDAADDGGPDLGALAELVDRQARLVARLDSAIHRRSRTLHLPTCAYVNHL